MLAVSRKQRAVFIWRIVRLACLLLTAYCLLGCSLPSLEPPECYEARDAVKQFYSFHFGNDMRPAADNLKLRERFLTPELFEKLSARTDTTYDYFTFSDDYPRTFKIAECRANDPADAYFNVQLYWRDDKATVQKSVHVNVVKTEGTWRISSVLPSRP